MSLRQQVLDSMGMARFRLRPDVKNFASHLEVDSSAEVSTLRAELKGSDDDSSSAKHSSDDPPRIKGSEVFSTDKPSAANQNAQDVSPSEVNTHSIDDWKTLQQQFSARTHCADSSKLHALAPRSVQAETIAMIFPPPSINDIEADHAMNASVQKLLEDVLFSLGSNLEQVYVTHALKCTAPQGVEEQCAEWIQHELRLLNPKHCILFGELAARIVLKTNLSLDELRGKPLQHPHLEINCVVTHSLSEVLRSAELKQALWQDIKQFAYMRID